MKMVKKILLGTLALAAVLTFAGCGTREEVGNSEIIQVKAGSSKASVDYTNETGDITRDFKSLQNQHSDAICKITTKINGNDCDGVMGYVFDYKDNGNDTVSFSIAGIRIKKNTVTNKHYAAGYIETYENITKDSFTSGPKFKKANGNATPAFAGTWNVTTNNNEPISSQTIVDSSFGYKLDISEDDIEAMISANNSVTLWVDLVGNLGTGHEGRTGTAGTYTVTFYKADPGRNKKANGGIEYDDGAESLKIGSATIPAEKVFTSFSTSLPQIEMGFYATVYAGQTLTGTWQFSEIKGEAEEIEE